MSTIITRIIIEHYRSVRYLELEPASLCALVGPNNAGKTNILRAVNLILGNGGPLPLTPQDYSDGDTAHPVRVDLLFAAPLCHGQGGSPVMGLRYLSPPVPASGEVPSPRLNCLDKDGRPLPANTNDHELFLDARSRVPFLLVDARRSFNHGGFEGQWKGLRKLLERLGGIDGEARSLLESEAFATDSDGQNGRASVPGPGRQSGLLVEALKAVKDADNAGAVIAIEEPEIFLHPHRERFFYRILRDLSMAGNQIIYATHSSNFVDIQYPEDVYLVQRKIGAGTMVRHNFRSTWNSDERFMLLREFDARRNELFFSRGVVLVEGDTERFLYPPFLYSQGIDIDEAEISIIDAGGKGNMPLLVEVLEVFDIPYVAVFDSDMHPRKGRKRTDLLRRLRQQGGPNARLIAASRSPGRLFIFEPNIEGALGFNPEMKDKVVSAVQYVQNGVSLQARHRLMEPVNALLAQIREKELQ